MKIWDKLSLLGVKEKCVDESDRKVIFLNRINVVVIILTTIAIVFDIATIMSGKTFTIGYLVSYIVVLLSAFHLVLNSYGFLKLSRTLLFIDIPFFFMY